MSRTSICTDAAAAVAAIEDGATVLVGGFGMAGMPTTLIDALIAQGRRSPSGWTSNCTDPAYVGAG